MQERRLLKQQDVVRLCSLPKSSLYALMDRGEFPRPVRLGKRAVRWWSTEVEAWLEDLPRSEGGAKIRDRK